MIVDVEMFKWGLWIIESSLRHLGKSLWIHIKVHMLLLLLYFSFYNVNMYISCIGAFWFKNYPKVRRSCMKRGAWASGQIFWSTFWTATGSHCSHFQTRSSTQIWRAAVAACPAPVQCRSRCGCCWRPGWQSLFEWHRRHWTNPPRPTASF